MRSVWFAIAVMASFLVGVGAGVLNFMAGVHPARAVVAGGGAFAAALTIGIVVITFFDGGNRNSAG